jgi:hypothetical protein
MNGERYCGDTAKNLVHDLVNEDSRDNGCQIDAIISARTEQPFISLATAHDAGFKSCPKCLGSR